MLAGIALFIAIVVIVIALRFKVAAWLAILVTALLLALVSIPFHNLPVTLIGAVFSESTIKLVWVTIAALAFAKVLEKSGLISLMADSLSYFNPKFSYVMMPLLLGMAPMPGSSTVAYSINKKPSKYFGINRTQSVFIHHWLSRVFEFSLPLFPSVIMTAIIFDISYLQIFGILMPLTIVAIIIGAGFCIYLFRKNKDKYDLENLKHEKNYRKGLIGLVQALWPILLLVVLVFIGLDVYLVMPLVFIFTALVKRISWADIKDCILQSVRPKVIALLVCVMIFAVVITEGHAAESAFNMLNGWGVPPVVMLAILPFLVHFAVGGQAAMIAVSFPMLMPFMTDPSGALLIGPIMLAFVSARAGGLASPANNSFVMLAEYSQTRMRRVYQYLLPAVGVIMLFGVLCYYIPWW